MENNIAILTVNYKNYSVTKEFLQSLKEQTHKSFTVFIADLSPDKKIISHPKELSVNIFEVSNKGYAYGINYCLRRAIDLGYKKFVIINNDTEVADTFVKAVGASLNKHPQAIIGGKIYYYSGYEYHINRYEKAERGKVIWYAGGVIDWKNVWTTHVGVDEVDSEKYRNFIETEFITGCFMTFTKSVIDRVGFFDESYFMYYEDADYCLRARKSGIKLYYDPSIVLWHKNAQSSGGSGSALHLKYQNRNRLRFGLKYAPWRTKMHLIIQLFSPPS